MSFLWRVTLIGMVAGIVGTGLGGLSITLLGIPKQSFLGFLMAFSSGIMIAVVFQDLIPEALHLGTVGSTFMGLLLGIGILILVNRHLPHTHGASQRREYDSQRSRFTRTGILLGLGIGMHNLPEGLAIGAGYVASEELGLGLAIALALHNIPEGMAMAGPMVAGGLSRKKVVMWTALAGLPMGIGAFVGSIFGSLSQFILSMALGFAAGAMIYLVFHELLPEAHKMNCPRIATSGAVIGILIGLLALLTL